MSVALRTGRAPRRLVQVACTRPALTVGLGPLFALLGVVYSPRAHVHDRQPGPPAPRPGYALRYNEYLKDFGDLDEISVVVASRMEKDSR